MTLRLSSRPARQKVTYGLRGYAASRQAYDARRRSRPLDPAAIAFKAIVRRDPCAFCPPGDRRHEQIAADHIVPLKAGGTDAWDNFTAACRACNAEKKDQDLLAFLLGREQA